MAASWIAHLHQLEAQIASEASARGLRAETAVDEVAAQLTARFRVNDAMAQRVRSVAGSRNQEAASCYVELVIEPGWWTLHILDVFCFLESTDGPDEMELSPEMLVDFLDAIVAFLAGRWEPVPLRAGLLGQRRVIGIRVSVDRDRFFEAFPSGITAVNIRYSI